MKRFALGISPFSEEVYAGEYDLKHNMFYEGKKNVTTDFRRVIVNYCSEVKEFEVDGMKFRATCERID